ncbi:MAG: dihydrolipoamide acetyltransferase family protein [Ilumatobacteraceae bacterium]
MATDFQMPKLGLTMEQATILEWLVPEGTEVSKGTPVVLIETDKTETEVEASGTGILHHVGEVGEVYECGVVIGHFLAEGEEPPAIVKPTSPVAAPVPASSVTPAPAAVSRPAPAPAAPLPVASTGRVVASPNARRLAAERGIDLRYVRGTGPDGAIVSEDLDGAVGGTALLASNSAAVATIAARDLANLLGVDLAAVPIDPIEGRITRDGVAVHVRSLLARLAPRTPAPEAPGPAATAAAAPAAPAPAALTQEPSETKRMTAMRSTIAKRMHASLQEMAQLTLAMDASMDAVVADRNRRKADGSAPGFTDYVLAACARALKLHPMVNAQLTADGIAVLPEIHVGLAVALEHGLMVPVVRNADELSLEDLSAETTRLAAAARNGSISPAELDGGTFSVSALGMYGVDMFTPVINPPNVGIMGVGRLRNELVLRDGEVAQETKLTLSLTWDHRVLDGAPAAEFAQTVAGLLATPERLA